jgi:hypothetical protein
MASWLKITSLKFISAVDAGAQGPISNVALVKRAPTGDEFQLTCKAARLDEAIGVVFGYAVASTIDGGQSPHIDLQGDAVIGGDELIKIALGFAEAGAHSDVMHDCVKDGWVPFVMPLNAETKKAFGLAGDVEGIAIGMKPSAETFKRFVSGEFSAFSVYGTAERTPIEKRTDDKSTDMRTRALESPRPQAPVKKDSKMTMEEALAEIAELKGKLAELDKSKEDLMDLKDDAEKRATLTDAQRAYHKSLDKADAKAFLAKSFSEREGVIAAIEKANEVVYTSKSTGETFRKSDDQRLVAMAKRQDEQAAEIAKRDEAIEKSRIRKQATELLGSKAPGDSDTHDFIVKQLEGNEKAMEALKGLVAASTIGKSAAGFGGTEVVSGPQAQLDQLIAKHATENKTTRPAATAAVLKTDEGRRLYAEASK